MAYIQTVGDIFQFKMYATNEAEQYSVNTVHATCMSLPVGGPTSLHDIAVAFSGHVATAFRDLISEDAEAVAFSARKLFPGVQTLEEFTFVDAGLGTNAGDVLPGIVAGLLALKTELTGQRNRGRLFLPFPGESANIDPGIPSAAYIATMDTFGAKMLGTPDLISTAGKHAGTFEFGIYHRTLHTITPLTTTSSRRYWSQHVTRAGIRRPDRSPV